ncbi:MAG: M1 family aminopeptidase [Planctomycetota bacterium]|nr:M1 family aminopeptidase [Planctomycetota bacterium]
MRNARLLLPLLLLALLLPAAPATAHDEPSKITFGSQARDFTQRHLTIRIRPDFENRAVGGNVTVRFESLVDDLRTLRLHAEDTRIHTVKDEGGAYLPYDHVRGLLTIQLREPLAKGGEAEVVIDYSSAPRRGLYFHGPTKDAPNTPTWLYSQGQASQNRRWIPCYDEPDDRTSWDMYVEVPENMQTVSNGVLLEQQKGAPGWRIDHWHFGDRSPTYLISLVCGEMLQLKDRWKDVELDYNAPKGHATEATLRRALSKTPAMFEFFTDYIGTPYPWPRYAQTLVWDFVYGGMENVTATTLNMRVLHTDADRPTYRSDGLVAHELVHMWYGDLITCRTWDHLWLNEGFATYFTDLFFEHDYGPEEFLVRRREQNERYLDRVPEPHTLTVKHPERDDIPAELGGWKAYNRGAAILHMLRLELGDDVFRRAIAAYTRTHYDQAVVSEQLRTAVERVAGRDLAWFWKQWVYGTGYPVFEVEVDGGPDPAMLELVVRQTQTRAGKQGLFRMSVPVRLGPHGPTRVLRVFKEEHRFPLGAWLKELAGGNGGHPTGEMYVRFGSGSHQLMKAKVTQAARFWRAMLAQDPDSDARLEAARALEAFGASNATALADALGKDDAWSVRRECARVLGRLGGPVATMALLPATEDQDARVRVAVAEALGKTKREAAGPTLVRLAVEDPNAYVRAAAARGAGALKVPEAKKLLALLLEVDSHREVIRRGALDGLRALGDPEGIELAKPFLPYAAGDGAMHQVRQAALDCITKLGPDRPDVHALLVKQLDDPYFRMRQWAATACGVYKVTAAAPKLEALWRHDWNTGVQGEAYRALEKMGRLPGDAPKTK